MLSQSSLISNYDNIIIHHIYIIQSYTLLSSRHGDKGSCKNTNQCVHKWLHPHPIWRLLRNSAALPSSLGQM